MEFFFFSFCGDISTKDRNIPNIRKVGLGELIATNDCPITGKRRIQYFLIYTL